MACVFRGLRQPSNFLNQLFPANLPGFVHFSSFDQLGDRRPASHRWNAAFSSKTNVGNALAFPFSTFKPKRKFENIAAHRILESRAPIRRLHCTRVAWMFEVV